MKKLNKAMTKRIDELKRAFSWLKMEPRRWTGCLWHSTPRVKALRISLPKRSMGSGATKTWWQWSNAVVDQGQEPSCVGRAWAAWLRLMLVRFVDVQLNDTTFMDGRAIWVRGRELYHGGDLTGGLQLDEGFMAMKDLGMIPKTSKLCQVPATWDSLCTQLISTPIVTGNLVHEGWFRPNELGCIDHAPAPTDASGGHATCLDATLMDEANQMFVGNEGSWGRAWPYKGHHLMTIEEYREGLVDQPVTALLGDGWKDGKYWERFLVEQKPIAKSK